MTSLWLMYHDVYQSQLALDIPASAASYHVSREAFSDHLSIIADSGRAVIAPQSALDHTTSGAVVLSFDDGWRGTFEIAIPLILERGWPAAVFVTRDFVGRPDFCTESMIVEAAGQGVEIGVHGTTHRMLSALSGDEIVNEFAACKEYLESLIGKPVTIATMPGGDWSQRIAAGARTAGLQALATSRPGVFGASDTAFRIPRLAVRGSTSTEDMRRIIDFNVRREVLRWSVLQIPRRVLGMRLYSRIRRLVVDRSESKTIFEP